MRHGVKAVLAAGALAPRLGRAWRASGVLPDGGDFTVYVGRFCFDSDRVAGKDAGSLEFRLRGRFASKDHDTADGLAAEGVARHTYGPPCFGPCETEGNLYLVVFDDKADHWPLASSHWNELTCDNMLGYASYALPVTGLDGVFSRTILTHERANPSFWHLALVGCGIEVEVPISYDLHAQNRRQGWQSEFGVDERGALQLQHLAALLFLLAGVGLWRASRRATSAEAVRTRPLLRLLFLTVSFSTAGGACLALHYDVVAITGAGLGACRVLGRVLVSAARGILALLLVLTARGWAIFYSPQEGARRRLAMLAIAAVVLARFACDLRSSELHDQGSSLHAYDGGPGWAVLALDLLLFAEAWRSMADTYRHETSDDVRLFNAMLCFASLLSFVIPPAACAMAPAAPPWVQAKYLSRTEVASRFLSTLLLCVCLRPSRLDAMVNARLEEGLETLGEPPDDGAPGGDSGASDREAPDGLDEPLTAMNGARPAE